MPGVWVFPGGAVDDADGAGDDGMRAAAARELKEEVGVKVDPAELVPYSRWITPEAVPIRFDTFFFLALAPPHSPPKPDGDELVDAGWFTAREALDRHAAGELSLVFPTIKHLETLLPFASAEEAIAGGRRSQPRAGDADRRGRRRGAPHRHARGMGRHPLPRGDRAVTGTLPKEVQDVFARFITTEYTTMDAKGQPITWPVTPYYEPGAATIDVTTGIGYPKKADDAARHPERLAAVQRPQRVGDRERHPGPGPGHRRGRRRRPRRQPRALLARVGSEAAEDQGDAPAEVPQGLDGLVLRPDLRQGPARAGAWSGRTGTRPSP